MQATPAVGQSPVSSREFEIIDEIKASGAKMPSISTIKYLADNMNVVKSQVDHTSQISSPVQQTARTNEIVEEIKASGAPKPRQSTINYVADAFKPKAEHV